jgi:hypothetical protein
MDYAYTEPDANDEGIQNFTNFYDSRANTTVLTTLSGVGFPSLEGLVSHLNGLPTANKPIGDVFICSHGNESGWLSIRMTAILPVRNVDYDVLVQYGPRLALAPATITAPAPGRPGTTIRFRACRIGHAEPFMQLLKSSFGGQARVSASKHLFSYGTGIFSGQSVVFEFLTYGFLLSVPEAQRIRTRVEAVLAFRNYRHPTSTNPFTYHNGTAIPTARWEEWMPAHAPVHKTTKQIRFRLTATDPLFNFQTEFRAEQLVTPDAVPYSGPPLAQPAARQRALNHLRTLPRYQPSPTNPYPIYQRNGFDSLQAYVNGHTWTSTQVSGVSALIGTRREYTLLVPIFNPANNLLLHNLMPGNGTGPPGPRVGLNEMDATLFWNQ